MRDTQPIQSLFKRERLPGDLVVAVLLMLLAVFLLSQLGEQTVWKKRTHLFAQPTFWPAVSLIGMTLFAILHFISSVCSPRMSGRWTEVTFWLRSFEYAVWFMAYVWLVPWLGYLPSTLLFSVLLVLRAGYRRRQMFVFALLSGLTIVVVFKSFLQVKIPGGALYEHLPTALRSFMLTYF